MGHNGGRKPRSAASPFDELPPPSPPWTSTSPTKHSLARRSLAAEAPCPSTTPIHSNWRPTSPIIQVCSHYPTHIRAIDTVLGRAAVDRLVHIIHLCPSIALEAFQLAVQYIHRSRDPSQYQFLASAYEQVASLPEYSLPPVSELPPLNSKWVDEVLAKNQAERTKLENELKTYNNNMIKESIRVSALSTKRAVLSLFPDGPSRLG